MPQVLFLKEMKLKDSKILHETKKLFHSSKGKAINVRGTIRGLCTLWNPSLLCLNYCKYSLHWILVSLSHLSSRVSILINISYSKKIFCQQSLVDLQDSKVQPKFIIIGDFNNTLNKKENSGESIIRDPFRETLEDLISTLHLYDIKLTKGCYTLTYRRII